MRDIKFRIWDKILQGWSKNSHDFLYSSAPDKIYVYPDCGNRFLFEQYVGLKDKTGCEIYEGDIIEANLIEYSLPTIGEVVFSDDLLFASKNCAGLTSMFRLNRVKVIGNVHDNPELAEKLEEK